MTQEVGSQGRQAREVLGSEGTTSRPTAFLCFTADRIEELLRPFLARVDLCREIRAAVIERLAEEAREAVDPTKVIVTELENLPKQVDPGWATKAFEDHQLALSRWVTDRIRRRVLFIENALGRTASRFAGDAAKTKQVTDLQFLGHETHNSGQQALRVSVGHYRCVYKPVDVVPDRYFAAIVAHLGEAHTSFRELPSRRIYHADEDYGLLEFVRPAGRPGDHPEPRRYYFGCGILLALAYGLRLTDLHMENVIASAAGPVLVDLECLLYRSAADDQMPSVRSTGLLRRQKGCRMSGFQGGGRHHMIALNMEASSDRRVRMSFRKPVDVTANQLTASGRGGDAPWRAFTPEILEGFREGYTAIVREKDDILAAATETFEAGGRLRYVVRPTALYALHLLRLCHIPQAKRILRKQLETLPGGEALPCGVLTAEMSDLTKGDVPYFYGKATDRHLYHRSAIVAHDFFGVTALQSLSEHLNRLGREDRLRQESAIAESLEM